MIRAHYGSCKGHFFLVADIPNWCMLPLQAFRNAFMALARKSPATGVGAARRTSHSGSPYNTRTAGGYVYVVPRGALGQVRRICGHGPGAFCGPDIVDVH